MTITTTRPKLPAVPTNSRYRCSLAATREALLAWFEGFRGPFGYEIEGHEIYWLSAVGPADGTVEAGHDPALSVGLRQGSSEGWILTVSACLMFKDGPAYVPVLIAKVWSPDAGCLLGSALMRAALNSFQPEV